MKRLSTEGCMKEDTFRVKKLGVYDVAAIMINDDLFGEYAVVLRTQGDVHQFTVEDFSNFGTVQVPNIVKYTEEEFFQYSLVHESFIDLNLLLKLQQHLLCNHIHIDDTTQYELRVQY